jgi:hypothetical protein
MDDVGTVIRGKVWGVTILKEVDHPLHDIPGHHASVREEDMINHAGRELGGNVAWAAISISDVCVFFKDNFLRQVKRVSQHNMWITQQGSIVNAI